MSSTALNQVYKTAIIGTEEALITTDVAPSDTSIHVSGKYMTQTPFTANQIYVLRDNTFASGTNGAPNAERVMVTSVAGLTAVALGDGIGYTVSGTVTVLGWSQSSGWSGGAVGTYTIANGGSILTPGQEMALQSADFNCRFKTLTDAPKVEFDDESSRFATGDEGRDVAIAGARSAEINFTEKFAWGGAVSTVPVWAKLMRSMGHLVRKWTTTGIEILPHTNANEITSTIWVISQENGMAPTSTIYRYAGCHGGNGCSISAGKIGDPYMLTGKYSGAYIGTTEISAANARVLTSPETSIPEILLNNTLTVPARVIGSTTTKNIEISQFSLDFGGVVNPFIDQSTSTGYAYYVTSDRDPKFTCNPYHTRKTSDDVDYIVTNQTAGEITLKSAPTSPHITIYIPNAQLLSPAIASREGYVNTNRTYKCNRNNLTGTAVDSSIPDYAMYSILIGARA